MFQVPLSLLGTRLGELPALASLDGAGVAVEVVEEAHHLVGHGGGKPGVPGLDIEA